MKLLPRDKDLTKEQLPIINLPTNEDYVIVGEPGTGKTVMAVYRAGMMRNKKVLLLVYNRPLMLYLTSLLSQEKYTHCECDTYHNWLSQLYRERFNSTYPQYDTYEPIWDDVKVDLLKLGKIYDHIIIDEAQDFPIDLFDCLKEVSKNITCFMDPNQAIETGKTPVIKAIKNLCTETKYKLTKNFRNTKYIYDAANLFCGVTNPPACTRGNGQKPVFHWCDNKEDIIKKICSIIEKNKDRDIGIILNNKYNKMRNWYNGITDELEDKNVNVNVQMFIAIKNHFNKLDFSKEDVKIVSFGTAKGLEFDMVLIPKFDRIFTTGDNVADLNRVYVSMTRAFKELHLFYLTENPKSGYIDTFSKVSKNRDLFTRN